MFIAHLLPEGSAYCDGVGETPGTGLSAASQGWILLCFPASSESIEEYLLLLSPR